MQTVETTITVSIPKGGATLAELEALVARAVEEAGRNLFVAAVGVGEEQLVAKLRRRRVLRQVKMRPRDVLTRFGWVRLQRRQFRDQTDGRYACPLDALLALAPRRHISPWVEQQAVALATRLPYRQAAWLLSAWLDTPVDHRTFYGWVQQAGARIVAEEDAQQERVFGRGKEPLSDPRVREIVVTEVDGTFLKAQREGVPDFEVRVGVLFSGKERESPSAKHQRYRLKERICYGGVEPASDFGERLFLTGEARLGLSHARHLLLVGDGAEWIEALAGHARWQATYQLDWWHLFHALHRTFPDRPDLVRDLKRALYRGDAKRLLHLVQLAHVHGQGDPKRVASLETYLRSNQQGFYGARRLRPNLSAQAKLVAVEGSGAIEKQMDLAVGRRFKGQGMRWTRRGANRLLKLRLRELERAA